MERSMLGLKLIDKVTNKRIRRKTTLTDIFLHIDQLKRAYDPLPKAKVE